MKKNEAKVTRAFSGAPDGERKVRKFNRGDTVTGDLAIVAVTNGWAQFTAASGQAKAIATAPENKAKDITFQGPDGGDNGQRSESKPRRGRPRKKASD